MTWDFDVKVKGKPSMRVEAGQLIAGNGPFAFRLRIIEEPSLTVTETTKVPRTWRERLWSLPWYPWVTHKQVTTKRAGDMYLLQNQHALIIHPRIYPYLEQALESGDNLPSIILSEHEYMWPDNGPYAVAALLLVMVIVTVLLAV